MIYKNMKSSLVAGMCALLPMVVGCTQTVGATDYHYTNSPHGAGVVGSNSSANPNPSYAPGNGSKNSSANLLKCVSWNEQRRGGYLVFENGSLVSNTERASLVAAYLRGALDIKRASLTANVVNTLDSGCASNSQQKIVDILIGIL